MLMAANRGIKDRLEKLGKLLTQPGVDGKINHYERSRLLEEIEELELSLKETSDEDISEFLHL